MCEAGIHLMSCEVGQIETASRLELAELVELLRHLEVIGCREFERKRSSSSLTCLVPPIALEVFFLYLVTGMVMKNDGKIKVVLKECSRIPPNGSMKGNVCLPVSGQTSVTIQTDLRGSKIVSEQVHVTMSTC